MGEHREARELAQYVANALFIGRADDEVSFRELVLSALDGDAAARDRLSAALHITPVDAELNDG